MAGLDENSSMLVIKLFKKIKIKAPILLIEHDMDTVFSLADRWNSKESITITSCAPSNGEHYAPESRIYGYSDGTIRLYPLLGSSDKLSVLSGHDGAVLSLLQRVRHDNERFLISFSLIAKTEFPPHNNFFALQRHK